MLASPDHANIAAIHGLEHAGHLKFLVLEYVPGKNTAFWKRVLVPDSALSERRTRRWRVIWLALLAAIIVFSVGVCRQMFKV